MMADTRLSLTENPAGRTPSSPDEFCGAKEEWRRAWPPAAPPPFDVVVVAASDGGLDALSAMLTSIPRNFPIPIMIVQHGSTYPPRLQRVTHLDVQRATDGGPLRPGTVYLASPDRHLLVVPGLSSRLTDTPRVHFARPAADVLFFSAVTVVGARVLGVVLSGGACDGAAGAARIRAGGGVVLIQSPETCRAPGMPVAAIAARGATFVLPPQTLGAALITLVMVPGALALFGGRWAPPAA